MQANQLVQESVRTTGKRFSLIQTDAGPILPVTDSGSLPGYAPYQYSQSDDPPRCRSGDQILHRRLAVVHNNKVGFWVNGAITGIPPERFGNGVFFTSPAMTYVR
jgi:hypothetical protein